MSKMFGEQLTLDALFGSTSLSGLTLEQPAYCPCDDDEDDDAPSVVAMPRNWRLTGSRGLASGWKVRAADNLTAIRLLRVLEEADRAATAEEQAVLAKFCAFGATDLAQSMFRRAGEAFRDGWDALGSDLEQLVSAEELAGLSRATQYAHFTPELIARSLWRAVERMGFPGGQILEPGCGTGLFLALMPEAIAAKSTLTGIEADPITAKIARTLFPDAWIRQEDFTKAKLPQRYELVIGNPPFSDRTVRAGDAAGRLGLSLHDYFLARSIERLQPGGLGVFVVSRWTMDKLDETARRHIAGLADLVGAVRLPQGAMKADAGTEVVVDLLVFQRRETGADGNGLDWADVTEVRPADDGEAALLANRYFAERPEMVLGDHAWTSSPYGPVYTCKPRLGLDLETAINAALDPISSKIRFTAKPSSSESPAAQPRFAVGTAADGATIKEGSYLMAGTRLHQVIDGAPVLVLVKSATSKEGIFAKHAKIIQALIPLRDALRAVLRAQEANEEWRTHQAKLRQHYQGVDFH